nr:putative ribonuclease H-like domain-containing protein [Tanacetum cinerariifolium]
MRIEQYFLMTDYSLWEVILNGDSPIPTRVVDGVVQPIASTIVEQRLAKKNELKARGTLLMALTDKHQLKFNIHKDAKSLMESIEKRFGGNKETKKVQKTVLKQHTKPPASILPNVDNLSDTVIYSFFASQSNSPLLDNDDLKQIDADDLEEMDLKRGHFVRECRLPKDTRNKDTQRRSVPVETSTSNALVSQYDGVGSYDWSFQTDEEPTNYALMAFTSSSSLSYDNEVAYCSKACTKACSTLQSHYDKLTVDFKKSQFDVISYKSGLESVEARLVVYQHNENVFEEDIKLLKLDVMLKDNALVELKKKFEAAEKKEIRYANKVFHSQVFASDELTSSESDEFYAPKPDLVFHDAPTVSETVPTIFNVEPSTTKPTKEMSQSNRPSTPIIEDWVSDLEDEFEGEPKPTQKAPSFVQTSEHVTTPRTSVSHVNHLIKDCDYYEKKMVQKPVWNHAMKVNYQNSARMTHPHSKKHVVPTAVLTMSRLVPLNAARPVTNVGAKGNWIQVSHGLGPQKTLTFLFDMHGNLQQALKDKGFIDSGCSRHMTRNISYLSDFEESNGGYVAFGGNPKGGKITGKGKIKTSKLDFDAVYFVKELKFNFFSVLQMYDKKNTVLFTDTECVVLSFDFKLPDEIHVLLRVPRENNMYNVDLKNIVLSGDLTCHFAKAALDESNLWHRRLGHINFKTMSKLVKGNLVRGLPLKVLKNNHTCVACKKGKQHRASYKTKPVSSVSQPIHMLQMDLFGPTFVKSLNKKSYCLVITDGYSRFSWVFFLATKDETSTIRKTFITGIETQINHKVKIIRSDNGTEFKNHNLNQLCGMKWIKREFSVARTPQQNGVAERKNRTLIEGARTMLADLLLPILFWVEAVNTACYVQKRVLVTKPHNKTPYELLHGSGPTWLSDIDTLTQSMNYQLVDAENQPNSSAGIQENLDAGKEGKEPVSTQQYVLLPLWSIGSKHPHNSDVDATFAVKVNESKLHVSPSCSDKQKKYDDKAKREAKGQSPVELSTGVRYLSDEFEEFFVNSTDRVNVASAPVTTVEPNSTNSTNNFNVAGPSDNAVSPTFEIDNEEDVGVEADFSNLETSITVSLIPTTRVHKDHPVTQIIVDLSSATHTRSMRRVVKDQGFEDPYYPHKVYKVVKALYGLHQAPRALYETLTNYLLENGFQRGKIDQTLFIKKQKAFEKLMKDKFQMSSMGELSFFLGLQVKQKDNGIFISQDKYVAEILRKFGLTDGKLASTPIDTEKPLLKDPDGEDVDVHIYMSMIGSLMYLTSSRPDIMFAVYACARFQVTPKVSHLHAIKRIFRYLKGKPHLGLWYPKDSPFNLVAYSDSDYVGASLDRKSTTRGYRNEALAIPGQTATGKESSNPFMADSLPITILLTTLAVKTTFIHGICINMSPFAFSFVYLVVTSVLIITTVSSKLMLFSLTIDAAYLMLLVDDLSAHNTKYTSPALKQKVFANMRMIGKGFSGVDTPLFDGMLVQQKVQDVKDAAEDEDDDHKVSAEPTPPLPTPATPSPSPTQEHIPSPPQAQTTQPSSPPQQQPLQTTDISMTLLNALLETCATLTKQVANLEQHKIAQAIEIIKIKQRVKRLEKKREFKSSRLKRLRKVGIAQRVESSADTIMDDQEDASKQGGINELDVDEDVTPEEVDAKVAMDADIQEIMQDTDKAEPAEVKEVIEVVTAAKLMTEVVTTTATTITATQVPKASARRRRRGVIIQDPKERATTSVIVHYEVKSKDKGKGILIEEPKPLKRQAQIKQDEAFARELEAELNANINWDNVMEQKEEEGSKRKGENLNQDAAKKQRIYEETEELKTHLQIVANNDDVYTEATPLALKLVQERFQSSEPNNFSDDFLLNTLKIMFEKPNVEASIWRDQRGRYGLAKVKSWKLFESYGVHILTLITTQMILLVEKKYPLTRFTLEQILNNVRLEVEEESEMSLELLRLVRRQLQEGYIPE